MFNSGQLPEHSHQWKYLVDRVSETMTHSELCTAVSSLTSLNFIGPDPADPSRILIKKIVQVSEGTYGYEEVTITKR